MDSDYMLKTQTDITITELNSDSSSEDERKLKIVLMGDSSVGKTSLIHRFINNTFQTNTRAINSVKFLSKRFLINDQVIKIYFWNSPPHNRFDNLPYSYFWGASGALIVYDMTNEYSFEHTDWWIKLLRKEIYSKSPIVLIGNKADLQDQIKISSNNAINKAKKFNIPILETSALNELNVKEAFYMIIKEVYKFWVEKENKEENALILYRNPHQNNKKSCA